MIVYEVADMKLCPNCHRQIHEGADFCPYCMQKLTAERQVKIPSGRKPDKNKKIAAVVLFLLCFLLAGMILALVFLGEGQESERTISDDAKKTEGSGMQEEEAADYSRYLGNWDTLSNGAYIRVVIEKAEGKWISGRAELESLSSGRVSSVVFSGEADEAGHIVCEFEDDGWGAKGVVGLEFSGERIHLTIKETGYSEDYTGEWSIGNIDQWLEKEDG